MSPKKKPTTATAAPKKRVRKPHRAALIDRLLRVNYFLGQLLKPKYATAGITEEIGQAQALIVNAGQSVPENWTAPSKRAKKPPTAEQLAKLAERAKRAAERLAAAQAAASAVA